MKTTERMVKDFRPGLYQHWKGHLYRALFLAQDSTNRDEHDEESSEEPVVVYVSLSEPHQGNICVRELWQWEQFITWDLKPPSYPNQFAPRFDWVGP